MRRTRATRTRYSPGFARAHWPTVSDPQREAERLRGALLVAVWGVYLGLIKWNALVTLTFDPKRTYSVSQDRAVREAIAWCNDMERALRRPLGWVVAPERGPSGRWHAHVLVVGTDAMSLRTLGASWRARNGFLDARAVNADEHAAVAVYASKEAALTGSVVMSDTIQRHIPALTGQHAGAGRRGGPCSTLVSLADDVVVALHSTADGPAVPPVTQ